MRSMLENAWRELVEHPWRTLAAASGLTLGAAVTVAGGALAASIERTLRVEAEAEGRGLLVLSAGSERPGAARASLLPSGLDAEDVAALRREIGGIERLAPASSLLTRVTTAPNQAHRTLVLGTTPDYFAVTEQALARGRWMSGDELAAGAPVCVAGPALVARLFRDADPLQSSVRVGTLSCAIVGVLAARGGAADDLLAMPLSTLQRGVTGVPTISAVYFSARPEHSPVVVAHQVDMLMRERRRLGPNAPAELAVHTARAFIPGPPRAAEQLPAALTGAAIAGYLLGGLGLLLALRNGVDERRRQKDAAGRVALPLRLVLEAALLSAAAGLSGAVLGLGLGYVTARLGGYTFSLFPSTLPLAAAAALLVGITAAAPAALAASRRPPAAPLAKE